MIINHTHKFIFIHIQKCAGTTAAQLLSRFSLYRDLELGGTRLGEAMHGPFFERFGLRKHSNSEAIRSVVGDDVWAAYFKFAFVRHPARRAVSAYKFLRRWRRWDGSEIMDTFPTVNDFIASDFWQTPGSNGMLLPQVDFLTAGVDYVGKTESFDESMDEIVRRIGLPPIGDRTVAFKNETPPAPDDVPLSAQSIEKIVARYRQDFEAFGYEMADGLYSQTIPSTAEPRRARPWDPIRRFVVKSFSARLR